MWLAGACLAAGPYACQSFPPRITGITIFPSDADGTPRGDDMARTELHPPIPGIGVRPGDDPREGSLFLNDPLTAKLAVTLARGVQNFLLFTASLEKSDHYVIAIFLDQEPAPALTAVTTGDVSQPVTPSRARMVMGLDGEPRPNHSASSAIRNGYQVGLLRAAFPLPNTHVDAVMPWRLTPDNVADLVGLITIDVHSIRAPGS